MWRAGCGCRTVRARIVASPAHAHPGARAPAEGSRPRRRRLGTTTEPYVEFMRRASLLSSRLDDRSAPNGGVVVVADSGALRLDGVGRRGADLGDLGSEHRAVSSGDACLLSQRCARRRVRGYPRAPRPAASPRAAPHGSLSWPRVRAVIRTGASRRTRRSARLPTRSPRHGLAYAPRACPWRSGCGS